LAFDLAWCDGTSKLGKIEDDVFYVVSVQNSQMLNACWILLDAKWQQHSNGFLGLVASSAQTRQQVEKCPEKCNPVLNSPVLQSNSSQGSKVPTLRPQQPINAPFPNSEIETQQALLLGTVGVRHVAS
jgi:hypothetical protein